MWKEQSGRMVGRMIGGVFLREDGCIDGRMIDSDFWRDTKDLLLL